MLCSIRYTLAAMHGLRYVDLVTLAITLQHVTLVRPAEHAVRIRNMRIQGKDLLDILLMFAQLALIANSFRNSFISDLKLV